MPESNPYPEALDLVHGALARFREGRGDTIRTTHAALDRLRNPSPQPVDPRAVTHVAESPASFVSPSDRVGDCGGGDKATALDRLRATVSACALCPHLASSRTQTVFGVGNPDADLMFVGEAPGAEEDARGEPFVGPAGQLLTKIIEAMGLRRQDVFIANVLKCRPDLPPGSPGNRRPTVEEMATCLTYLRQQIAIIRPKALVALGATATEGLLKTSGPMRALRGLWHDFDGIPTMATYHPSFLLRPDGSQYKRKVWEDMLQVMEKLRMTISEKQRGFFLTRR